MRLIIGLAGEKRRKQKQIFCGNDKQKGENEGGQANRD